MLFPVCRLGHSPRAPRCLRHAVRRAGWRVATIALTTVAFQGCGGGTGPGQPTPTIGLSAGTATVTVASGATETFGLTVTRSANYTGAVDLSIAGVPNGVTIEVGAVGSGTSVSVTVTVSVVATTPPGTYPITIRAAGNGVAAVSATVSLAILAAPSYLLSLSPASLTIVRGASATTTLTIERTNFTDAVTLAATSLPEGMTVSFASPAPTGTSSTVTVATTSAVAAGTYPVSINGSATPGNRSVPLTVTVLAPSLALAVNPGSVSAGAGTAVTIAATIVRSNFTAPVLVTLDPVTGFALTSTPSSIVGDAATLDIAISSVVSPGTYPLALRAVDAATGTAVVSAPTILSVEIGAPAGPIVFDYTGCTGIKPLWLAIQDGPSAAWATVTGVGDVYTVNPTQSRVGLVYVWSTSFHHHVIRYMTRSELAASGGRMCPPDQSTVAVLISPTNSANVYQGSFTNTFNAIVSFGLTTIPSAPRLLGMVGVYWYPAGGERVSLVRNVDTRNVPVQLQVPVDYATASPVTTSSVPLTNLGGRDPTARVTSLYSIAQVWRPDLNAYGARCAPTQLRSAPVTGASTAQAISIPAAQLLGTDVHAIRVQTYIGFAGPFNEEVVEAYYRNTPPSSIEFPSPLGGVAISLASSTPMRFRFQFAVPGKTTAAAISYLGAVPQQNILIRATSGYLAGAGFDFTTPDFRGLSGYSSAWVGTGTGTFWSAGAEGGLIGAGDPCIAGSGTAFQLRQEGTYVAP